MTIKEPGWWGQRSTFENVLIDEISRKSNTLEDRILQMTWDSFEIINGRKDDYDGLCVQSCNKWWGKLFFIGMEGVLDTQDHLWSGEMPQMGLPRQHLNSCMHLFLAAFWSCFVPVWTFLWPPLIWWINCVFTASYILINQSFLLWSCFLSLKCRS